MTTEQEDRGIAGWEDPPERPVRYNWYAISRQLKKKPGKWAKVFDRDRQSLVVALRSGSITALQPENGFEFQTRNNDRSTPQRTCTLYARYNPDADGSK